MRPNSNLQVLQCIDSGMNSIGSAGRQAVFWYLFQKRNLRREEVPENPNVFLDALKTIFGQGAGILERTIVKELKRGFNVTLGEDLTEVLSLIRRKDFSPTANNHMEPSVAKSRLED